MHRAFKAQVLFTSITLLLSACGSRTSEEVGGKTSWLSSCDRDSDCAEIEGAECIQKLCTKVCETNGCDQVNGTYCATPAQSCLAESSCLPACDDNDDCARFGSELTCQDSVCVQTSCAVDATTVAPDSSTAFDSKPSTSTAPMLTADSGDSTLSVTGTTFDQATNMSSTSNTDSSNDTGAEDGGGSTMERESGEPPPVPNCTQEVTNPSDRPHPQFWQLEDSDPIEGEAACEGVCGYVYESFWEVWEYDETLVCPLALSECADLREELDANPARCNTVDDCTAFNATTAVCEPVYGPVPYFHSALFTPDERQAREALVAEIERRGCRQLYDGYDGPLYSLACENNLCTVVPDGDCLSGRDSENTDAGPMVDPSE